MLLIECGSRGIARPAAHFPITGPPTFARAADKITDLLQPIRKGDQSLGKTAVVRSRLFQLPMMVASQQGGATGRAPGRTGDALRQSHAMPAHAIKRRRLYRRITGGRSVNPRLIVGDRDQNVGTIGRLGLKMRRKDDPSAEACCYENL